MDFFNELIKNDGYLMSHSNNEYRESFYFFPDFKYVESIKDKSLERKERIYDPRYLRSGYYYIKKTKSCIYALKNHEYKGGEYISAKPVECPKWVLREVVPRDTSLEFTQAEFLKYLSKCFKSDDVRSCLRIVLDTHVGTETSTHEPMLVQSRSYLLNTEITEKVVKCLKKEGVTKIEKVIYCPYNKGDTRMYIVSLRFWFLDENFYRNDGIQTEEERAKENVYIERFRVSTCTIKDEGHSDDEDWCGPEFKLIK